MSKHEAISRLQAEMDSNKNNSYIQVVGQHLIDNVVNEYNCHLFLQDAKTIGGSLTAMAEVAKEVAKKEKSGSCAVLSDSEGFAVVAEYFGVCPEVPPETTGNSKVISLLDIL